MAEERLKLAIFIDFDNIQIGVKDTLGKDFDVSVSLKRSKNGAKWSARLPTVTGPALVITVAR